MRSVQAGNLLAPISKDWIHAGSRGHYEKNAA
jgi:hypothetical protein